MPPIDDPDRGPDRHRQGVRIEPNELPDRSAGDGEQRQSFIDVGAAYVPLMSTEIRDRAIRAPHSPYAPNLALPTLNCTGPDRPSSCWSSSGKSKLWTTGSKFAA